MDKKTFHKCVIDECCEGKKLGLYRRFVRTHFVPQYRAVYLIRKMQLAKSRRMKRHYSNLLVKEFGIFCGYDTQIDIGLKLPHPNGIIIGNGVKLGKNVTIYQQVTLGSSNIGGWKTGSQPTVGDGSVIFSGAKVLGMIELGKNTTVGANAVLNKSTEDGSVWAGIPARELHKSYALN